MSRLLDDIRRVIRINSSCPHGNEELVNYLVANIREIGLKADGQMVMHSLEDISKRQFNLVAVLGDPLVERKIKKGLLLLTHLDTAESGVVKNWTTNDGAPFNLVERNDCVYGLGTADAKIDFLCKLAAMKQFIGKKIKAPIYLVGTCGSEYGMFGCRYLLQSLTVNPKYVLVGMPTNLELVTEQKPVYGLPLAIEFQVVEKDARGFNRRVFLKAFGKCTHHAAPTTGENAILKLLAFLKKAHESGFELRVARLEGRSFSDQVPDQAQVEFFLTAHQFEDFKSFFSDIIGDQSDFQMEMGGLGDIGISFLPENVFFCLLDVIELFSEALKDFPDSTLSLGQCRQTRGRVSLYYDFRPSSEGEAVKQFDEVQKKVQRLWSRYPALNLKVKKEIRIPALNTNLEDEWVQICRSATESLGVPLGTDHKHLSCEAGFFSQKGYQSAAFGPGVGVGNSHTPHENVPIAQIEQAVRFYVHMIERVCL